MLGRIIKQGNIFDWSQDDIERLLRQMQPRIRAAFIQAIIIAQQENTLAELAVLANEGRLLEVLDAASQAGAESLADLINVIIGESGQATAASMARGFNTIISFDQVNQRAVDAMQANRLRLITEFVNEQRLATREALIDGIRRGINPRAQARVFRGSIGLTGRQVQAVNNFRTLLREGSAEALTRELRDRRFDPTVRRAVAGDIVLTDAQIERMVTRYGDRFLKFRSEVIARTEALRSVHEGTELLFRQAIENGNIDGETLNRTWHTASDVRVRDSHAFMNDQERPLDLPFRSGDGNDLRFPGDINAPASDTIQCRCAVSTRVTKLALAA